MTQVSSEASSEAGREAASPSEDPIDSIYALLRERGGARWYDDENVTQLEHALQCAMLAESEGEEAELVTAALLHDIGHLLNPDAKAAIERGEDARHEVRGQRFLARWFGEAVALPVRLHVEAKRFLTATDHRYLAKLSPASIRSLRVQGGPLDKEAVEAYVGMPYSGCGVQLRRWDDQAKVVGAPVPDLEHFRPFVMAALKKAQQSVA